MGRTWARCLSQILFPVTHVQMWEEYVFEKFLFCAEMFEVFTDPSRDLEPWISSIIPHSSDLFFKLLHTHRLLQRVRFNN